VGSVVTVASVAIVGVVITAGTVVTTTGLVTTTVIASGVMAVSTAAKPRSLSGEPRQRKPAGFDLYSSHRSHCRGSRTR
jgi:hypothetical protein